MSNLRVGGASFLYDATGNIVGLFHDGGQEQFLPTYSNDATGKVVGVNGPAGLLPYGVPALAWANRPPATQLYSSFFATDVGGGNIFACNGTRFKPANGSCILDAIDTPNAGVTTTAETQVNPTHALIPAGVIAGFDRLRVFVGASKSGAVDICTIRLRFGPLGTVADPLMATIVMAASDRSYGAFHEFKRTSATSLRRQGNGNENDGYSGSSTTVYSTAQTVSNMDSTAMYFSISMQMTTGGSDLPTLEDYTLELFATDS
jgi:hypothetical protein